MALIDEINSLCLRQLGRLPNLENPAGYNDKIQWLKLYDQRLSQIVACDKVLARELVAENNRIKLLYVGKKVPTHLKFPFVIKTSHDSGTSFPVFNFEDLARCAGKISRSMGRLYGIGKGESAYRLVDPMILCEEYIPEANVDYKFHCVNGIAKWIQVIWDRASGKPKECILLPDGSPSGLHMDEKMQHVEQILIITEALNEMTALSEQLSSHYRYVRVDLYWAGKPLFGELTFWPRAGCYKSKDEPIFGEMLDIDMSYKYEPICP